MPNCGVRLKISCQNREKYTHYLFWRCTRPEKLCDLATMVHDRIIDHDMKQLLYKWHMLTMLYREKYEIGMRITVRRFAFRFPSDFAQMTDPLSWPD